MSAAAALRSYLDELSGGVFWTDAQIFNALNEAQVRVWAAVKFDEISSQFPVTAGQDIVTFDSAHIMIPKYFLLDPDFPTGTGTNYLGPRPVKYFATTMAKLEQYQRNWRVSADQFRAQPLHFAMYDAFSFRLFPFPDQTYHFELWGIRYPPQEITTTTDNIMAGDATTLAPHLISRLVVKRAAQRLFQYTRPDLAGQANEEAEYLQQLWRRQWRNRQSHNAQYRLKPLIDRVMDTPDIAGAGVIKIGKQNFR